MSLATTCPKCKTSFKVVPDQLKLRRGLVRCGACAHVFSGIDYLRYLEEPRAARGPAASAGVAAAGLAAAGVAVAATEAAEPGSGAAEPGVERAGPGAESDASGGDTAESDASGGDTVESGIEAADTGTEATDAGTEAADAGLEAAASAGVDAAEAAAAPTEPPAADAGADALAPPTLTAFEETGVDAETRFVRGSPEPPDARPEPPASPDPARADDDSGHRTDEPAVVPAEDPSDTGARVDRAAASTDTPEVASAGDAAAPAAEPAPDGADEHAAATGESPGAWGDARSASTTEAPALGDDAREADALAAFLAERLAQSGTPVRDTEADVGPTTEPASRLGSLADESLAGPAIGFAGLGDDTRAIDDERKEPFLPPAVARSAGPAGDDETDAVDFFATSRRAGGFSTRSTMFAAMASVALAIVLAAQLAIGARDWLASRIPPLRPVLAALAAPFGLEIAPPRELGALTIESFELQSTGAPNLFALSALLRNAADRAVRWPSMELTLTDAGGGVVVRKVLAPHDYLGEAARRSGEGVAPNSEVALRVGLEAGGVEPTGYSVKLFYP